MGKGINHEIQSRESLFAWEALEDSPSLKTIRQFVAAVPDASLLQSLSSWRGRGRDDYPVSVLWGTLLLTIVLRHPSIESCLGELRRNEGLRRLIGIGSESGVPKKWNMSRFLDVLGTEPHLSLLHKCFDGMIQRLGKAVSDLGERTAGDSSALNARRERGKKVKGCTLPEPSGGRKEYVDDNGCVTHAVEWFGYKFHLLVDVKHEVILAYRITDTKTADSDALPEVLASAQANLPENRIKTLAFDKAADDVKTHGLLNNAGIKPVIQNRNLWKEEPERKLPGHDGRSNIVYDEAGTVYCYDKLSEVPVRRAMSYIGHEPARGTLKYRCPARHCQFKCPSDKLCNAGKTYGMTLRIKQEIDLRRFPPIPRATKQFERLYKGRTAVERVNARVKVFWGADDGNVVGARRFHAFLGTVMVVHAGLATLLASSPRYEGTLGKTRLSSVAQALTPALSR
ncbi:MAG: hypothetical protein AMXMBFR13_48580 [Phycisphaerae bacterium]